MRSGSTLPHLLLAALAAACGGESPSPEPARPAAAAPELPAREFVQEAARRLLAGEDLAAWCAAHPLPADFEPLLEEVFASILDDQAWFEDRAAAEGNAWDEGAAEELAQLAAVLEEVYAACLPGASPGPGLPEGADAEALLELLAVYLPEASG